VWPFAIPQFERGEDAVAVFAEGALQFDERLEARALRPGDEPVGVWARGRARSAPDVGGGHVDRDRVQITQALGADLVKEAGQGGRVAASSAHTNLPCRG
jgi:hypothetical protein